MGRESKARKARTCPSCEQQFYADSQQLQEHVSTCTRLRALNLLSPDIVLSPGGQVITRIKG